jgi:hypothetical protein
MGRFETRARCIRLVDRFRVEGLTNRLLFRSTVVELALRPDAGRSPQAAESALSADEEMERRQTAFLRGQPSERTPGRQSFRRDPRRL